VAITGGGEASRGVRRRRSVALPSERATAAGPLHASSHTGDEDLSSGTLGLEVLTMKQHVVHGSFFVAVAAVALAAIGCSSAPRARAPIQMVKIETSPGGGSGQTPPLALHSKIPNTTSANDLENSGPKIADAPKEKAKIEPRLAAPDHHVELTKHSSVPEAGNLHGSLSR
jgi:hypothetical protein